MSYNEKTDMLKFTIYLNLFLGIYNLYLFYYSTYLLNLIIGSLNIGVWVFNRDKLNSFNIYWSRNKKIEHKRK